MKKSGILLILLLCLFMTGCSNRFAEEEYDSVEKIVESEDRYATESSILNPIEEGYSFSVSKFDGRKTLWTKNLEESKSVEIDFSFVLTAGQAKIVHIDADGNVTTLIECTPESSTEEYVTKTVSMTSGENRLKIVGFDIEEMDMKIIFSISDNMLDKFLAGEINAEGNGFYPAESFHISDLPQGEEWDSYSIGDRIDLDNDGEEELIINGPYGGMYLDTSADGVKVFAGGDGTASNLSYVHWNGETWIVHSDTMHSDRTYYKLEKYDGAENVVDTITLESYRQEENEPVKYYLNGSEVAETEYGEYYQNLFGDK